MRTSTSALLLLLITGCVFAGLATAAPLLVVGQIQDESGNPIAGASLLVRGRPVGVDSKGEFTLEFDSPTTVMLQVSAPGYYPFAHTLHRSDFVAGRKAVMPVVELVEKVPGRRLMLFAGDSMLSRRYFDPRDGEPALLERDRVTEGGKRLLQHVKPYIELADYASVNLETQLSATELTDPVPKSVTFYSPVELATLLEWAGFDYFALGNNHMFDYREEGLQTTYAALEATSLDHSGAGFSEEEARRPARVDIDGLEHRFFSYVGWPGTFVPSQVAEESKGGAALGNTAVIAEDLGGQPSDVVSVLQLHAGLEYAETPALSEQTTMRQAVRDGADIAIGHHPHVLQGFEIYKDRLIAYSLGNFLFDQYHYTTQLGMLLFVWMDGQTLYRAEAVPLHINGYVPTPATGTLRHAVLARLARLSKAGVCMRPSGFHAVVSSCDDTNDRPSNTVVAPQEVGTAPVHLRTLGASPLSPVVVSAGDGLHRLGVDLLRRGDFEYARLFGAHDRTWIEGRDASLKTGDNNRLEIRVPAGGRSVRTGMKVFERVFTLSNPATFSGTLSVDGEVRVRVLLQRRRATEQLDDELRNGPVREIGTLEASTTTGREFSFDYNQPRIATRSVRLLIEVDDTSADKTGASVSFDDLAWVEWQTPWLDADDSTPRFATHIQFQP